MVIDQEILINCTDNDKKVNGKVIRLFRGGLDVAIENTIIKMNLRKNNVRLKPYKGAKSFWLQKFKGKPLVFHYNTLPGKENTIKTNVEKTTRHGQKRKERRSKKK